MIRAYLFIALAGLSTIQGHATRYHVNAATLNNGNGLSWESPFVGLQSALAAAQPGDEIWVAAGTYFPTSTFDRNISFVLHDDVNLHGGFAGWETDLNQRNIASNITVLSGDIGTPANTADNSHHVITADNISTIIVLDGFRIMHGNGGIGQNGGGLSITNSLNGELQIKNCQFARNSTLMNGGALYLAAAVVSITDCVFEQNQALSSGAGGAICAGNSNGGASSLTIFRSRFNANSARQGACLYNTVPYAALTIDRCSFTNNVGSISVVEVVEYNNAQLTNSYLIGNTVNDLDGRVLDVHASSSEQLFTMINCTVAQNFNLLGEQNQSEVLNLGAQTTRAWNCIIHGNTPANGRQVNSDAPISYSLVQGGHENGELNLDADPLFVDPYVAAPANFDASTRDHSLQPTSPAINTGSDAAVPDEFSRDLIGSPRVQGAHVDMGCYESSFTTGIAKKALPMAYFDATRSLLHFGGPAGAQGSIAIHDATGRLRSTSTITGNTLAVDLPSGWYIASGPVFGSLRFVIP